jgi:GNAT superfamily N-acetyltransferase
MVVAEPGLVEGPLRGGALDEAVGVAVRAFDDDPFFSYLFPKPAHRHRSVARLHHAVLVSLAKLATTRSAVLGGRVVGVAVWVPPGSWPYPASVQLRSALGYARAFLPDLGALGRAAQMVRSVEHAHPRTPQWYLQLLMVDPDVQRQGIGGRLQAPELETCDRDGVPAWVETQKEENLAYYGRFGFEVVKEHRPSPSGPAMWSLQRQPRG